MSLGAIESSTEISEKYTIPGKDNYSEVYIKNLHGSIKVETYNGNVLQLEATKTIIASNDKNLEKGKSQISLKVCEFENGLFIYLDHPCVEFDLEELNLNYNCNNNCGFRERDYKFNMDIVVKIPKEVDFVDASTINNGRLLTQGLNCNLDVSNINGSLSVEDHSGNINASTINGDLYVNFSENPKSFARFSTINGDIEVNCLKNLSAKIQYKSMHGDFFTNYDDIEFLAPEMKKIESKRKNSIRYKLGFTKSFKIGSGETNFSFKTLNGDMLLKSE